MQAHRGLERRVRDVLNAGNPVAIAQAIDAFVATCSPHELRLLITRSAKRMTAWERAQLALYVDLENVDDLLGNRFGAFLRQNPRAIASLDPPAVQAILAGAGEVEAPPKRSHAPFARALAISCAAFIFALLPLAAQYLHQRGMLAGLTNAVLLPPVSAPFEQILRAAPRRRVTIPKKAVKHVAARAPVAHRPIQKIARAGRRPVRSVALTKAPHHERTVAWKFDPRNNPYFNPALRERRVGAVSPGDANLLERARLEVIAYLHAMVAGDLPSALAHLGLPADADTSALPEQAFVTRNTRVRIVGTGLLADKRARVEADIHSAGREYFEVFHVARDGPAVRIVDRFYIPVNRAAEVATRSVVGEAR